MKLSRENKFSKLLTSIKNWASEAKLSTIFGEIGNFFGVDIYEEEYEEDYYYDDDEFEDDEVTPDEEYLLYESNGGIYYFEANNIAEYSFVRTLVAEGYTAVVSLGVLSKEERSLFVKKLRLELFKFGIHCNIINEHCLIVAPRGVEIIDFEEREKPTKAKILYLKNYRDMK